METTQLKYFQRAAKLQNFSKVAKEFSVPPSSVSASVKKLETELGVKLFHRSANTVRLNEYGDILNKALEKCEGVMDAAFRKIGELSDGERGEINMLILANRSTVTDAIFSFRDAHSGVSFNISHISEPGYTDPESYDIIVTNAQVSSKSFEKRLWIDEELCLAVHCDDPMSKQDRIRARELADRKFICMPKNSSLGDLCEDFFAENGICPERAVICDDPQYVRRYVESGLGITLFPTVSWKDNVSDKIKLIPIENGLFRKIYVYTNKNSGKMTKLFSKQFLDTGHR